MYFARKQRIWWLIFAVQITGDLLEVRKEDALLRITALSGLIGKAEPLLCAPGLIRVVFS